MSFGQPSPQGIAALYRGNPEKLDARIKQEQQVKPGMPPDLAKLMALSINVNEEDAVKRQAAMAALQGMQQQSPTGKPPTVAESLQQQAIEKAKQVAVQQQQQQKGLQALMGQAAPAQAADRPPQPERQGSIEELQSNLGDSFAGGGIVAFSGEKDSDVKDESLIDRYGDAPKLAAEIGVPVWAYRQAQDFLARTGTGATVGEVAKALVKEGAKATGRGIVHAAKTAASTPAGAIAAVGIPATQFTADVMKNNPKLREAYTDNYMLGAMDPDNALGAAILNESAKKEAKASPTPVAAEAADAETEKLKRLAAARQNTGISASPQLVPGARPPAPAANKRPGGLADLVKPAAPAAPAAPAEKSAYDKFIDESLARKPETVRAEALARRKAELGDLDTSAQEAYIKSLQGRLGGLEESTDPYERVRAHLRRLATAGGRNWMETGAKASVALQDERKAAEQQKAALLKEIMGESTKVVDLKRGEKEKVFAFAEKEYDETYKRAYDAAKERGLDERESRRQAHQSAENALNRANQLAVANIRSDAAGGRGKELTEKQRADIANQAAKNINAMEKTNFRMQMELAKNPGKRDELIAKEAQRLMDAALGNTIAPAPGAASPGGTPADIQALMKKYGG